MEVGTTRERFTAALDSFIEQVREDRSVLAAILCGSLAYDEVWERSDIDLVLVTVDDRKVKAGSQALYSDGINIHALLVPRAEFRKTVEGSERNSFIHSFLARGRLIYSHDETVAELCAGLGELGARDRTIQLFRAASGALAPLDKAHKWLLTRGDLEYTALYILAAVSSIAKVEVISAGLLADREVVPRAAKLNPELFRTIYLDLLNQPKTRQRVEAALATLDGYLATRAATLFAPLIEHLEEVGDTRSATDLEDHFKKHFDLEDVLLACEYLANLGLIGKASAPVQLTKRSNVMVQELAFFALTRGQRAP
jgi:predicted nucleotidyltransferase